MGPQPIFLKSVINGVKPFRGPNPRSITLKEISLAIPPPMRFNLEDIHILTYAVHGVSFDPLNVDTGNLFDDIVDSRLSEADFFF